MSFWKELLHRRETAQKTAATKTALATPPVPSSAPQPPKRKRQAVLLDKDTPSIVVDPFTITHAFIVVTPTDIDSNPSSKLLDAVFELNKKRNPKLWQIAQATGAADAIKFAWLG